MKEDKKKKILEKAIDLFGEARYLKTTVEEITNSLGISKGSFYPVLYSAVQTNSSVSPATKTPYCQNMYKNSP